MKIIFLGGFIPDSVNKKIQENTKRGFQSAANNFQLSFIDGFIKNNVNFKLISAYFIGFYPLNYKRIIVNDGVKKHRGIDVRTCFFINLPFIKNIFKGFSLFYNLKKTISKQETNYIIVYSLNLAYVISALIVKLLYDNIKICVCVTDLHDYPADTNIFYRFYLKYFEKPILDNCYKYIDKFVFLTEKLSDKIVNVDYCVMEGLYILEEDTNYNKYDNFFANSKTILYTGTLDGRYGIDQLIEVFKLISIKENIKLIICGDGNRKEEIMELSKLNRSILFLGRLPFKEIKYLQSKATILINPRTNEGDYNKYSFPSKTMEYLASGRPVLMHKLDGIPKEYDQYLNYFSSSDSLDIKEDILRLVNVPTELLLIKGEEAKKFIIEYKNSKYQINKFLKFLKK